MKCKQIDTDSLFCVMRNWIDCVCAVLCCVCCVCGGRRRIIANAKNVKREKKGFDNKSENKHIEIP